MKIKIKNIVLTILIISLILGGAGTAFAANFSDISSHWSKNQIDNWVDQGLASGYPDGTFKPDNQISRAEFVTLINRAFNVQKDNENCDFTDVKTTDWFFKEVAAAKAVGYIAGYENNTFKPNHEISRQEVAVIVARLLKLDTSGDFTDLDKFIDAKDIPSWAKGSFNAVVKAGIINGYPDQTVKSFKSITRAEAIVVLNAALGKEPAEQIKEQGIEGTVTYNGKAVKDAVIKIYNKDGYEVIEETETDEKGQFKVELNTGVYDITAATDEAVSYAGAVEVTKDETVSLEFTLEVAAIVSGKLYDKNNNPAENVMVVFTTNPTFVTTTDEDGEYTLALLPDRKYKVRAVNPDNDKIEVLKENLDVGSAGRQQKISSFNTSFSVGSSTSDGGNSGTGKGGTDAGDNTGAPFVTDASITIKDTDGTHIYRPVGGITGGVKAKIILQGSPEATIAGGCITVSEDATLSIISPSILAGESQKLKKGDNQLKSLDVFADFPLGFDLLDEFTGGDVTIKGQLVDESGQKSNVELIIILDVTGSAN